MPIKKCVYCFSLKSDKGRCSGKLFTKSGQAILHTEIACPACVNGYTCMGSAMDILGQVLLHAYVWCPVCLRGSGQCHAQRVDEKGRVLRHLWKSLPLWVKQNANMWCHCTWRKSDAPCQPCAWFHASDNVRTPPHAVLVNAIQMNEVRNTVECKFCPSNTCRGDNYNINGVPVRHQGERYLIPTQKVELCVVCTTDFKEGTRLCTWGSQCQKYDKWADNTITMHIRHDDHRCINPNGCMLRRC